jgi:hypothetical protein
MRNLRLAACALAVGGLIGGGVLAGCGDDDEGDSGSEETSTTAAEPVEEVTLTANDAGGDYTFELSETPTADTKSVVFDNQGKEPHFLVYAKINEGYTLDEAVELQGKKGSAEVFVEKGAGPGQTKTFPVEGTIEPGSYAMLCPIPGPEGEPHYKLGQLEEFEIQ